MALTGDFGPVMSAITPTSGGGASPFEELFEWTIPAGFEIDATNRVEITSVGSVDSTDPTEMEFYRAKVGGFSTLGDHHVYKIEPNNTGDDLFINLVGDTTIPIPIHVKQGFRNVYMQGVGMDLVIQLSGYDGGSSVPPVVVGNGRFQLPNKPTGTYFISALTGNSMVDTHRASTVGSDTYSGIHGWNKDARIPGGMCVRLEHSGIAVLEGCYFECNGFQGDIVVEASNGITPVSANNTNLKTYMFAVRAGTNENQGDDAIYGDGIHGDLSQQQSDNIYGKPNGRWYEHVYYITSGNGIISTGGGGLEIQQLHMSNFQYEADNSYEQAHPLMTTGDQNAGPVATMKQSYPYDTNLYTLNNVNYDFKSFALHFKNTGHKIVAIGDSESSTRIGHAGCNTGQDAALIARLAKANLGPDYVRPTNIKGGTTHTVVS